VKCIIRQNKTLTNTPAVRIQKPNSYTNRNLIIKYQKNKGLQNNHTKYETHRKQGRTQYLMKIFITKFLW